jgi:beta-phosphoglucomutase-like phosphatase (HAD superfamily)
MPSPLRALIWDVDGTLAETERDGHRVAFNRAFDEAGLSWHWDVSTYGELLKVTGGKERLLHWWRGRDAAAAATPEAAVRIAQLHAAKTRHYAALVQAGAVALRPGVERVLRQARAQGLVLAIATTTTEANVQALLRATLGEGSPGWFDVIGAGDVVPAKKPAPDIYDWVLARGGLHAGDALALEDSAHGVAAAHGAGLPVVLTRSLYSAGEHAGPVLADLDGLGNDARPAHGTVAGQPWQGVVDLATLRRWHAQNTVIRWPAAVRA